MFQSDGTTARPAPTVWSVSGINATAKQMLEQRFGAVQVAGEISNMRLDRSGHRYFVLKDTGGVLSAAMFRSRFGGAAPSFDPVDGMQVVARGQLTIYGPSGRYQLVVRDMVAAGAGALQAAMEALKAKLLAEGLFAAERKRPLPALPRRVAVITSREGAVWRDIVQVAQRRFGRPPLLLVPCRVQGVAAVDNITQALQRLAVLAPQLGIDVVILARGGGSLEDLAAFNSEPVARALAALPVPSVSAVGHETDTTIVDFVADVRAPTPSAAAELVFAQRHALVERLQLLRMRIAQTMRARLRHATSRLQTMAAKLGDGQRLLWPHMERLAQSERTMERAASKLVAERRRRLLALERRLQQQAPQARLARLSRRAQAAQAHMHRLLQRRLAAAKAAWHSCDGRLHALSPLAVLGRGYAIVQDDAGTLLRDAATVPAGTRLRLRLQHGTLAATADGSDGKSP